VENLNPLEILKMGLPGLVLLLSVLSYRLLSKEQGKEQPSDVVLKSIKQFMYLNFVFAGLTVAAPLIEKFLSPPETAQLTAAAMQFTAEAKADEKVPLGKATVCYGSAYANRYLLLTDAETSGKMAQVKADTVMGCNDHQLISISVRDAEENLGWLTTDITQKSAPKNVRITVALPGSMFIMNPV